MIVQYRKRGQWNNGRQRGKGGKREDIGGQYFRSSWEANWARYLNWQVSQRLIAGWQFEPKTFEFTTIKRGAKFYTPDFLVIHNDGQTEWHEVKGWMDPKSLTRQKRFAKFFPKEKLRIVGKKDIATILRQLKGLIRFE